MATPSKRRSIGDEERKPPIVRKKFMSMDAYTRHKFLISHYRLANPNSTISRDTSKYKTDSDVLREYHKFQWDDDEEDGRDGQSKNEEWGRKLAKAYYDKLFKEYCICDLTHYKENKVAMRWRVEKEVVDGKGQFICGEKHCDETDELKSWEVNFSYVEDQTKKNALVKLRLCSRCSKKLNYHHKRKEAKKDEVGVKDRREESSEDFGEGSKGPIFTSKKRNVDEYLSNLLE